MFEIKQTIIDPTIINATITNAIANIRPSLERAGQVWLAYSGGLDSTVLLHALKAEGAVVKALHVNHQMSSNANAWQQHCIQQCDKLDCRIVVERVAVRNEGKGLEHAARAARYAIFNRYVKAGDVLLMAHHLDDECETLLFRLLRGSGLTGVTGIKKERTLMGGGKLLRPLLSVWRKEILEYANSYKLNWIEDESNRDIKFDRNYLRETVLPLFQHRWPNFRKQFSNSITLLRESEQLLVEYAQRDLANCNPRDERLGSSIDLTLLAAWSAPRINHVLRLWAETLGYHPPGIRHLEEVKKIIAAREDAAPTVQFGNCELRRYRNRLYCLPRLKEIPAHEPSSQELPPHERSSQVLNWNLAKTLQLPDGSQLTFTGVNLVPNVNLEVKFRTGGERCKPKERDHSQTLKKLFQEYELEPWLRDRVPLIYFNNELIAVGDLWICSTAICNASNSEVAGSGTAGFAFSWIYPALHDAAPDGPVPDGSEPDRNV